MIRCSYCGSEGEVNWSVLLPGWSCYDCYTGGLRILDLRDREAAA